MSRMMPLPDRISQSSSSQILYRTKKVQFGDGYSQRSPDGINSNVDTWQVNWEYLNSVERDTILEVLNDVEGADYIYWTPPNQTEEKKYIIAQGSSYTTYSGNIFSISIQVEQVFDL